MEKNKIIFIELGKTKTLWAKPCSRFRMDLLRRQRFDSMAISPRNQLLGLVKKTHTHSHTHTLMKLNTSLSLAAMLFLVSAILWMQWLGSQKFMKNHHETDLWCHWIPCSPNFITSPYWHCRCHPMSSPKRYKGSCLQKKPARPMNPWTRLEILGIKDIWDTTITSINLFYGHFGDGIWLFLCSQKQPSNMFQHRQTA